MFRFGAHHHSEHPFYVTERSDQETRPKPEGHPDLSDKWVGDKLKQADGTLGEVRYVNTIQETRTMYNLEVQEAHTFFVGTQGWLVHNATNDYNYKNRTEAFNAAKDRAGIPRSQQFSKQWEVGNDPKRKGMSNYRYSEDPGTWGRFFQYETPQGPRVVVEHTGDPDKPPHFHAGEPKGNSWDLSYDFKENRYAQVGDKHHLYYGGGCP